MPQRTQPQLVPPSPFTRQQPKRLTAFAVAFVLIAVTLITTPGTTSANDTTAVQAINNNDRREVARTYRDSVETNLAISSQWNGSTNSCNAGSSSSQFDAATVESINWFRRMAGLQNVTENSSQSVSAQQAALMMDAQNQLAHLPGTSWRCYTATGAQGAERSNLTLGASGPLGVLGQIADPGASNTALGHRRWLLFPALQTVGVGNTSTASAIHVLSNHGNRSAESAWVQWPPAGFVPDDMVFDRWSISYAGPGNIDFSNARVSVVENGRALAVTVLRPVDGFGDPTLGFEVSNANPTASGDTVYQVSVTGMVVDGRSLERSYTVTAFDARAAMFSCGGQPATIAGSSGPDTILGSARSDVIVGLGGNDRIEGLMGNDTICAGTGNDVIVGGTGNDRILAGTGNDTINSGSGNDVVAGDGGADKIIGGSGNDILRGGLGQDKISGSAGNDSVQGGGGNDVCWGDAQNSTSSTGDSRQCEQGR